jgi:phosphoribosylformylglycinamidine cyclo-ligase
MSLPKTYQASGVNIEAGNELVRRIKPHAARTPQRGVMGGIGGFGALFAADWNHYKEPVLVSATDGVGTKLKLAFALEKHDTIGIDLVAMCANDLLCSGAKPLFFLDYFGTGHLQPDVGEAVVKGIADGCVQADCALIGGETAELPGFYTDGEYDLAGFCVGIVDKEKIIDGADVAAGDVILGLASSGLHSNGYSLARKVLEPLRLESTFGGANGTSTLGEAMLEPTRIYVQPVLELLQSVPIKAMAHITGGGFYENIPRIMPENTIADIKQGSWPVPELFSLIAQRAEIEEREMFTTFNMGIGMALIVSPEHAKAAQELLQKYFPVHQIGEIRNADGAPQVQLV